MKTRERDLRHDADPVRFGAAMVKCEGYPPQCSQAGRCSADGLCFKGPPNVEAARMIEGLIPRDRAGMHFAYLQKVAEMLREDRVDL